MFGLFFRFEDQKIITFQIDVKAITAIRNGIYGSGK